MAEIKREENRRGNDVVMVEVNLGDGGRGIFNEHRIRVAEIAKGSEYTSINAKNVIKNHGGSSYNWGRKGAKENAVDRMEKKFQEAVLCPDHEKEDHAR